MTVWPGDMKNASSSVQSPVIRMVWCVPFVRLTSESTSGTLQAVKVRAPTMRTNPARTLSMWAVCTDQGCTRTCRDPRDLADERVRVAPSVVRGSRWTIACVRERGGVIRNRTNWISGWILALGVPAFVIGVADPLATHTVAADGGGWNPFMLAVTGGAAVVSLAGYVLFARPMIVLGATHVRVRNPLSDCVFARSDITDVKRGFMYPSSS